MEVLLGLARKGGSMRQMPQELVGKVWSSRCIEPPMDGALSNR
jgi:hypothetical protein